MADFDGMHQYWASLYGGGGKDMSMEWVMTKAKARSRTIQMVEFKVAMMFTCTHNGPVCHYKA